MALSPEIPYIWVFFNLYSGRWVAVSDSLSQLKKFEWTLHSQMDIGVRDGGARGAVALPTFEKFAKISHNRAENRPKVGQNLRKQWIFYRAAPLNFISPNAYANGQDSLIYGYETS